MGRGCRLKNWTKKIEERLLAIVSITLLRNHTINSRWDYSCPSSSLPVKRKYTQRRVSNVRARWFGNSCRRQTSEVDKRQLRSILKCNLHQGCLRLGVCYKCYPSNFKIAVSLTWWCFCLNRSANVQLVLSWFWWRSWFIHSAFRLIEKGVHDGAGILFTGRGSKSSIWVWPYAVHD